MLPRDILFVISNYTCGSRLYHKKRFDNVISTFQENYFKKKRITIDYGNYKTIFLSKEEIEFNSSKGYYETQYTYPIYKKFTTFTIQPTVK